LGIGEGEGVREGAGIDEKGQGGTGRGRV